MTKQVKMKVRDIIRKGFVVSGDIERDISGVTYDSRNVKKGHLFVAVRGANFDGHGFIEAAITKGAVAIVYEKGNEELSAMSYGMDEERVRPYASLIMKYPEIVWIGTDDTRDAMAAISSDFYRRPSEELTVIGITGTNGKTTTSYILRSILRAWGKRTGLLGTISYMIDDTAYDAPHTTPESPDFQSLLRDIADRGCSHVIAEISSHALSQKRADYTRFRSAVFTNLTRDHLDFHHTMEAYFSAKKRLFTELLSEEGAAVINTDDPYGERLAAELRNLQQGGRKINVITCSIRDREADVSASDIKTAFRGLTFTLRHRGIDEEIVCPLVGTINVYNILSAVGVALSLNIPIDTIKEGIAMTGVVKGRFEKVDLGQDFLAVVDYAHTEDALERLLLTARQLLEAYHFAAKTERMMKVKRRQFSMPVQSEGSEKGKIITVFGCGGNRDRGKRVKMGEIAAKLSDFVIVTSDNPRNEDPKRIIKEIEKGIAGDNYIVIPDRRVAISMAVELASSGDIVLVAGKGHEDYQEIQGVRHDFSDRVALENAIRRTISRPAFGGGTNFRGSETARC